MNSLYTQEPKIEDLSLRTIHKILIRANKSCQICKWNKSICDVHHIVAIKHGGNNEMNNLVIVCPNCHRCIHVLGSDYISLEELQKLSIGKTFSEWVDYYNPKRNKKFNANFSHKKCYNENCHNMVQYKNKFCSHICSWNSREKNNWNKDDLIKSLEKNNGIITSVAKDFSVSDNAIRKKCKAFDIDITQYKKTYKRKK